MNISLAELPYTPFDGQDVRWLLLAQARLRGDQPFIIWEPLNGSGRRWTFAEVVTKVVQVAAGLAARGVKAGDRVLVHLDNCPEGIFSWFACGWIGAIAVTTNTRSSPEELEYFWGHSGAAAAITQPRYAQIVERACANARWLAITTTDNGDDAGAQAPAKSLSFDGLVGDAALLPERRFDPRAPFSIQYTSGTTSRPKAVLWTHANALWGGQMNVAHEDLRAGDRHLLCMPLFHANAQSYSLLAALWAGAACVVLPRFSASAFWAVSVEHACTWASLVPFCSRALASREVPDHHFYRLWGGAVCDPPTDSLFGVRTLGWWGMTETITHGLVGSAHLPNTPGTVGRAAPGYEILVADEDGRPVEPGQTGELFVRGIRGLSLFAEYFLNHQATADAFNAAGYFVTGDRITVNPDGSMSFSDRSKDMLKVGGENVAASEIERVIEGIPGVVEVAVVARPDDMLDEVPVAFVIAERAPDIHPGLEAEVLKTCRERLASFKVPREVRFVDSLPRSTLEKVAKAQLRTMLRSTGESGEAGP